MATKEPDELKQKLQGLYENKLEKHELDECQVGLTNFLDLLLEMKKSNGDARP